MPRSNSSENSDIATGKKLLMEAAARLAARQGATSLVLREIAREAGLNHNTFYRHFDNLEDMMHAIVEDFATQLRHGLTDTRRTLRPGEPPTTKVIGWLFDFAQTHRDVFVVAMRERFGPRGPVRDAVRSLLEQLTEDMRRDLSARGYLPDVDDRRLRRLLGTNVQAVFGYCLEYLEAPRRRKELIEAAGELIETLLVGAAVLSQRNRDHMK